MRNNIKRCVCIVLTLVLLALTLSGCGSKEKRINFVYPFTADVNSYDPQIASTSDEFLIIENTFEGLIRIDDEGNIIKGCADSWEISDDGLTYTFNLKQGLKWNITTDKYEEGDNKGEFKDKRLQMLGYEFNPDITAHDFVFALRRAVLPETEAPMFPSVSSITNAVEINSGKLGADKLGVTAKDDYTLVITLTSPDSSFMQTLSSSVAMPCNEEFFNATKGRYGLDTKYTLFNGQFYVNQILESSYLLKRNEEYKGEFPTVISQLSLKIVDENGTDSAGKTVYDKLESGSYDAAFITGQQSDKIGKTNGITLTPYEDTTWALLLNTADEIFSNTTLRHAFCIGLSRIAESDRDYLSDAKNLTPPSCLIGTEIAAEKIGVTAYTENNSKSIELWLKGIKELESRDIEITVLTTPEMETPLKELLQGVQSGIATVVKDSDGNAVTFTLKVETLEMAELDTAIAKREYDAVLYPFKSASPSPITFLRSFTDENKTGFDSTAAETALSSAEAAKDNESTAEYVRQAEQAIVDSFSIYPVLSQKSYYACAKNVCGINFHAGSGRVSFVNATREE